MNVNYDLLLPQKILFNLKEVEDIGIIKTNMAKKLIYNGFLEIVKIGNKVHISRGINSIFKIKYLSFKKYSLSLFGLGYILTIFFLFNSLYLKR